MEINLILEKIIAAEKEAAEMLLQARTIFAETKSGRRDVVTEYDRKIQALLIDRLSEAVEGAAFFCEENDRQDGLGAEHIFIIDPIDGTMNFVRHFNHSCISVAYMNRGVLSAAAVYNPYVDELFTAARGQGAFLNGSPIHVEKADLADTIVCYGTAPYSPELCDRTFSLLKTVQLNCLDVRRQGSAELDLCSVAAGRAGAYFELALSFWDYAAGMLIVEEAGGIVCTLEGAAMPMDGSKPSLLAGGRAAAEKILSFARE